MLHEKTIIPIDQCEKNLKLLFFGELYNHINIVLQNIKTNVIQYIYNATNFLEYDSLYGYSTIILENLEPASYYIWTEDISGNQSYRINVYINGDTRKEQLTKAATFIGIQDEPAIKRIISHETDQDNILMTLFQIYCHEDQKTDMEEKLQYALLLQSFLDVKNRQMNLYNSTDGFSYDESTSSITFGLNTSKIVFKNMVDDKVFVVNRKLINNSFQVPQTEDALYVCEAIDEENKLLGSMLIFNPTNSIHAQVIAAKNTIKDEYNSALDKNAWYPLEYLSFSEQEREYLALIEKLEPASVIYRAPTLSLSQGTVFVEFETEEIALMKAIGQPIYLSIREPELCLDRTDSRRILIPYDSFDFHFSDLNLIKENYLYWIESENRTIISNIAVLKLESTNLYKTETDLNDSIELNERIRQLNIYKYEKHTKPYVLSQYENVSQKVFELLKLCENDRYCNSSNAYLTMLKAACISANAKDFIAIAKCIMEDRTVYGKYRINFFDKTILYKYKSDTIVVPTYSHAVCVIEEYRLDGNCTTSYYKTSQNEAYMHRFENCNYAVISFIDWTTYERSGYILIDFNSTKYRANLYRFLLDNVEVVY